MATEFDAKDAAMKNAIPPVVIATGAFPDELMGETMAAYFDHMEEWGITFDEKEQDELAVYSEGHNQNQTIDEIIKVSVRDLKYSQFDPTQFRIHLRAAYDDDEVPDLKRIIDDVPALKDLDAHDFDFLKSFLYGAKPKKAEPEESKKAEPGPWEMEASAEAPKTIFGKVVGAFKSAAKSLFSPSGADPDSALSRDKPPPPPKPPSPKPPPVEAHGVPAGLEVHPLSLILFNNVFKQYGMDLSKGDALGLLEIGGAGYRDGIDKVFARLSKELQNVGITEQFDIANGIGILTAKRGSKPKHVGVVQFRIQEIFDIFNDWILILPYGDFDRAIIQGLELKPQRLIDLEKSLFAPDIMDMVYFWHEKNVADIAQDPKYSSLLFKTADVGPPPDIPPPDEKKQEFDLIWPAQFEGDDVDDDFKREYEHFLTSGIAKTIYDGGGDPTDGYALFEYYRMFVRFYKRINTNAEVIKTKDLMNDQFYKIAGTFSKGGHAVASRVRTYYHGSKAGRYNLHAWRKGIWERAVDAADLELPQVSEDNWKKRFEAFTGESAKKSAEPPKHEQPPVVRSQLTFHDMTGWSNSKDYMKDVLKSSTKLSLFMPNTSVPVIDDISGIVRSVPFSTLAAELDFLLREDPTPENTNALKATMDGRYDRIRAGHDIIVQ